MSAAIGRAGARDEAPLFELDYEDDKDLNIKTIREIHASFSRESKDLHSLIRRGAIHPNLSYLSFP